MTALQARDYPDRRLLHAVLLNGVGDAARLLEPLARALDGSGPAILPVDASLPAARIRQLIDAFAPNAVIDEHGEARIRSESPETDPATAVIIGTSGSTGEPKGVELSAAALSHSARASLARAGARPGERWLACLPASHVAGLQVLVRSLIGGTAPVIAAEATARALDEAADAGCAHVSVVPTQLVRLLGSRWRRARRSPGTGACLSAARRPARPFSTRRGKPASAPSPPTA